MSTLKTLLCVSTAVAFLAIPDAPAQADLLSVCAKKGGGTVHTGKCRKGEKRFTLDRPMARHQDVTAFAEKKGRCGLLDEFLGDDVALCVGHDVHIGVDGNGYGPHCFLWLETFIPMARAGLYGDGEPVFIGLDEVSGQPSTKKYARALITFVDPSGIVTAAPVKYMTADGYVVTIENIELLWPQGGECRAYARTSERQR